MLGTAVRLDDGLQCIDLRFQGLPGVIAAYLVEDAGERALIEIGPTSTLDTLISALESLGIDPDSISKVLVTHIHLDHAGAAGAFMQHFPRAQLVVHQVGAPHLIDPSKLVASAGRIWGDRMDRLWGEVVPVPPERVTTLGDGDVVSVGSRRLTALYTPGHASHHVAYHDPERAAIFSGDVAGVRLQGLEYARPPTPPPDLDLELWSRSVQRLLSLKPGILYLTHFGPFADVEQHLGQMHDRLYSWADMVQRALLEGRERDEIITELTRQGDDELKRDGADQSAIERYELGTPYFMTVDGFLRYFRKRVPA